MIFRRLDGVRRRWRTYWRGAFSGTALVLSYHRVSDEVVDPFRLSVHPEAFRAHVALLRRRGFHLATMSDLAQSLETTGVPKRTAVITFDDGYADNLHHALPVLAEYEAPATVFVAAGQVESGREFWWDALTRVFLETREIPDHFNDEVLGGEEGWRLGMASRLGQADLDLHRSWRMSNPAPTARQETFRAIWKRVLNLPAGERDGFVDRVTRWAEVPPVGSSLRRPMSAAELQRLAASSLIEIGGHTWSHSPLPNLSPPEQQNELEAPKQWLERLLAKSVVGCSYPHGQYNATTVDLAKKVGYRYACGSQPDLLFKGDDPLSLPRITVKSWSAEDFEAFLTREV